MKTILIILIVLTVFGAVSYWTEVTEAFKFPISRKYYLDAWDLDVFEYIKPFDKPVFIIHGDKDAMVDVSYGKRAAEAYQNAELEILPGEIHGFYGKGKTKAAESSYRFLEKHRLEK